MIEGSDVGMNINSAAVPILPVCRNWWKQVLFPVVFIRNKNFRISQIETADTCPAWLLDVFFDPQTAGGLFFSLPQIASAKPCGENASLRDWRCRCCR